MALLGVLTVSVNIRQVVDDVDRAGEQAQEAEARQSAQEGEGVVKLAVKNQRGEDEAVFDPLPGPHGLE